MAYDNISVTAVPEPGTYALMALGLAGVMLAVRRQRKA
ncbi:MAG: PEP-CTERM sorting domain-containing protein [Rhizobacter sp.]